MSAQEGEQTQDFKGRRGQILEGKYVQNVRQTDPQSDMFRWVSQQNICTQQELVEL